MFFELLFFLLPLFIGYFIRIKQIELLKAINNILNFIIYIILFFMGIVLAFSDNLNENLQSIFIYAIIFFIFTIGTNIIILAIYNYFDPWHLSIQKKSSPPALIMFKDSLRMCGTLLLGFLVGLTQWEWLIWANKVSEFALIFLLFLIGIQLRSSNMTLRQIILNRRGFIIALLVIGSSLIGGTLGALVLQIPINYGLAISSSNGWYSLSSIMLNKTLGSVWGATAFFNDLFRELFSLFLIPVIVRNNATSALGISGATSMDFTLPIFQRCAGIEIVPAAIVHGFIISLLGPILMVIFTA